MNPNPQKFGQTETAPIHLLELAEFDFHDGQPPPPNLGKTETPINVLAGWVVDGGQAVAAPRLVLTFRLRPDANRSAVTFDLFAAYAMLNRYEISLGGSGLTPDEDRSELMATNGEVRLVLSATDSTGAIDRLAKLKDAIDGATPIAMKDALIGRSFGGCEVELQTAA